MKGYGDSQFTTVDHVSNGPNEAMMTDGHEDSSFMEGFVHALEHVGHGFPPMDRAGHQSKYHHLWDHPPSQSMQAVSNKS